jgi:hypothetical protein
LICGSAKYWMLPALGIRRSNRQTALTREGGRLSTCLKAGNGCDSAMDSGRAERPRCGFFVTHPEQPTGCQ